MTHKWKAGDRAMVIIKRSIPNQMLALKTKNGTSAGVGIEALYPLPAPDANPHQELRDAVVEAAMMPYDLNSFHKLNYAIDALRAALTPPKPVNPMEALRNAWEAPRGLMWAEEVQDALDAAEKAWKEKS